MRFHPSIGRTAAMARKEGLHILRDPRSLWLALAMPVMMLLLFGYALTLDIDRVPTVVYDQDRSPQSRELVARFAGSRYFQIIGEVDEYPPIKLMIDRSQCTLALVIPRGYSSDLNSSRQAQVQLLVDGSNSNTASISMGYAEALVRTYSFELQTKAMARKGGGTLNLPVDAQVRVWYNPMLQSKNYIVPGLIAVILMIISAMLTSLTVSREWETGTMEQLLSTPVRAHEIVLGKMTAYFVLGFIDTLIVLTVGVLLFGVPLHGSPLLVLVSSAIFLLGALFSGIYISAANRTQLQAFQLGLLISFLPTFLLSGFVYAIENMPPVLQLLSYLIPARYFITIVRGIFLKGVGLEVLWLETLLLVAYAVLLFLATTRKLKAKLA
jgi:ABC-2 type transport system permease protein